MWDPDVDYGGQGSSCGVGPRAGGAPTGVSVAQWNVEEVGEGGSSVK